VDAAAAIEGGIGLGEEAGAFAGSENGVEVRHYKGGMGALGWVEIGFEPEVQIYAAGHEPNAFALGHFRGLGDFSESENAGVKSAGAVFAGDGNGDLHVVDAEDWHESILEF
jgi:hypothetical protein